jgi:hypothetical protein
MWIETSKELPPVGKTVNTMVIENGQPKNEQKLIYERNLWWTTDKAIYVYYTPTHWEK